MPTHVPEVEASYVDGLFDLSGKIALVTGGASGLGEAIALGYTQAGATVVITDINEEAAQAVIASVAGRPNPPVFIHADVTQRESIDALVDDVIARYGRIDILVNSAGSSSRHLAEDFPEEIWDRIMLLNVKGTFMCCQAVGRTMLEAGGGCIINISSIGASIVYPHTTAYLQSKGAVSQMTRSLALEWVDRGIRVNAIAPSLFDTPLVRANDTQKSYTSEFIMARTPVGRKGQPYEVVGPAIFLASDAAAMVVGHILQVDGGYLIT